MLAKPIHPQSIRWMLGCISICFPCIGVSSASLCCSGQPQLCIGAERCSNFFSTWGFVRSPGAQVRFLHCRTPSRAQVFLQVVGGKVDGWSLGFHGKISVRSLCQDCFSFWMARGTLCCTGRKLVSRSVLPELHPPPRSYPDKTEARNLVRLAPNISEMDEQDRERLLRPLCQSSCLPDIW